MTRGDDARDALDDGRAADAIAHATAALGRASGAEAAALRSIRALARAIAGDAAGADDDARAVDAAPGASLEALARARAASALALFRGGAKSALEAQLARSAALVGEHATPRERALFRAIHRATRMRGAGAYREPAPPGEARAAGGVGAWIAAVAPETAPFADGRADDEPAPLPRVEPSRDAASIARRRSAAKASTSPSARAVVALWLGIAAALFFAFELAGATHVASSAAPPLVGAAIVLVAARAGLRAARRSRRARALAFARRAVASADVASAEARLDALAACDDPRVAAGARLELARIASADADFTRAMAHCDAGVGALHGARIRRAADAALLASLVAESAVANACAGRAAEADAELALLASDFPSFASLAVTDARVRLVRAARARDVEGAAAVARARTPSLWLPRREDVLCDLALAARGADDDERRRLAIEIAGDARLARWIEAVGPAILDAALRRAARAEDDEDGFDTETHRSHA